MTVLVLGAGIMGSGIGQVAATAGHHVVIRDIDLARLEWARAAIDHSLSRFVRKGVLSPPGAEAVVERLTLTTDLEAAAGATTVIEAVHEDLALKRSVLDDVAAVADPDALLATNTSQLSISAIAAEFGERAERVVGMHFFNPPVLMELVELIRGDRTSDETLDRARAFAEGIGKEVVVCKRDSPGFITTRAYAALRVECLRMLDEGLATAEDIDRALKLGFNFPMGPLELADFNGLDTVLAVCENLAEAHGDRFREPGMLRRLVDDGRLGRKSGAGIYDYD